MRRARRHSPTSDFPSRSGRGSVQVQLNLIPEATWRGPFRSVAATSMVVGSGREDAVTPTRCRRAQLRGPSVPTAKFDTRNTPSSARAPTCGHGLLGRLHLAAHLFSGRCDLQGGERRVWSKQGERAFCSSPASRASAWSSATPRPSGAQRAGRVHASLLGLTSALSTRRACGRLGASDARGSRASSRPAASAIPLSILD